MEVPQIGISEGEIQASIFLLTPLSISVVSSSEKLS